MRLNELLHSIEPLAIHGDLIREVQGLFYDSRQVIPGGLFCALRGVSLDGHRFIDAALEKGATAVVMEDDRRLPEGVTAIRVLDARKAMARMASTLYGNPTGSIPLVGITGTNGKTTTSYLVEAIMEQAGIPTAVLGTVAYRFRQTSIPAPHTTPESVDLQRILRELLELGAKGVVMEVSSHALEQHRVDGCSYDVGVFTNLTRDHLDYHGDMASYLESKQRLFRELLLPDSQKPQRTAVVNVDDSLGHLVARSAACPVLSYGLVSGARVSASDVAFTVQGISGVLVSPQGDFSFHSPLLGRFNLYNILAACSAGIALGLPLDAIKRGIEGHRPVPGRMEPVPNQRGVTCLVDYAHTGDALENVLRTIREIATCRIITMFGCGGDRDRGKRPVMGEISAEYSDLTIITSDNPRSEEPGAIIEDIRRGIIPAGIREYQPEELQDNFYERGFTTMESRRDAIRMAVRLSRPGDLILLAGKGHEDYQLIAGQRLHFDDREEATIAFRELN